MKELISDKIVAMNSNVFPTMEEKSSNKKFLYGGGALLVVLCLGVYFLIFAPVERDAPKDDFIIPIGYSRGDVAEKLRKENFIRSKWAFNFFARGDIKPGGYYISPGMSVRGIARKLSGPPEMVWVTIPEGLRKEEIAETLAGKLGWDEATRERWVNVDTAPDEDHSEGVYFPDTYLIPLDETSAEVAARFRRRFEEKFAPFAAEALAQNIRWPTVIKIASLVQREAAGKSDMPLIAGIIWNRLLLPMKLDIDATLQYARGDTGEGWWAPIKPNDRIMDSPYNTYRNIGLPPTPIANPGIDAIEAVLYPAKTPCLYYLHDPTGVIHCAETFEEHKANIAKYL